MLPRPDAIWTSVAEIAAPYLWAQLGRLRRPLVLDLDWTFEQQEAFAPLYFARPPRQGPRRVIRQLLERAVWHNVSLFTPWSHWAADSLRRQGISGDRIRVLPPGVDLDYWHPSRASSTSGEERLRLLFVGADFWRKGGDLLLRVLQSRFADRCEVDIVTRGVVPTRPGVRVHRAEPNSSLLRSLYAQADVFVLPTRAECFGIAAIEALASGVPVIMGDVGGARDIVQDGENGWLIEPTAQALSDALEHALQHRTTLPAMGRHARRVAEQRFDGQRNDTLVVELLLDEVTRAAEMRSRRRE
jgi:glycosyltransferase involved in cell wall biosynthesis